MEGATNPTEIHTAVRTCISNINKRTYIYIAAVRTKRRGEREGEREGGEEGGKRQRQRDRVCV